MPTITLQGTSQVTDTFIDDSATTSNYGSSTSLYFGETSGLTNVVRGLLKFDLSSIPANSSINSATLTLKVKGDGASNSGTWQIYRCLRSWVETEATWNVYSSGNNWGTAGAGNTSTDRENTAIATKSFGASELVDSTHDFTLNTTLFAQMITGGGFTNNGFVLKSAAESDDLYEFYASETGTSTDGPKLVVDYTPQSGMFLLF